MKALLALEDGRTFECRSFTGNGETWGEVVFNTGMMGYQEVLTDPSYRGQIVTMTYPLIGNYGINPEDIESDRIQVAGFIVREYQEFPSNFRSKQSLTDYLKSQNVLGIHEFDTRALTLHIRTAGAMRAYISTEELDPDVLVQKAKSVPSMVGRDLVREVTVATPYYWENGKPVMIEKDLSAPDDSVWRQDAGLHKVIAFDYGIKYNILRNLVNAGCQVIVVPGGTSADIVKRMAPDGIFLSNGPGDPEPVSYAVETIQEFIGNTPIFGICLGHQILGRALGAETYKLKFGHRGANQPVKNLISGRIEITSQNHGFCVDVNTLDKNDFDITHINLNDNTLEGFRHRKHPILAVQYHPEASPGPHDANYLFKEFADMMKKR